MGNCGQFINSKERNPIIMKNLSVNKDEKEIKKNEGKLRIYFYGDKEIKSRLSSNSHLENKIEDNNINYTKGAELLFNSEYFIFEEITEENNNYILKEIKEDFRTSDFYDVIIITVNTLLDKESISFFNQFQNISDQKSSQPFILFITKKEENPNVKDLYKFITNEYFDKRTLFSTKYPSVDNEEEEKIIIDYIFRFRSYYNEQGNSFDLKEDNLSNYKFNILLCGKAGTGKSSFINKFLGNRRAKEGEGLSMTHKIVEYTHQEYPINIYDTPGFEDKETVDNVIKLLEDFNKKLIDARKKINLILYFFPYSDRSVFSFETPLIKMLNDYNSKIIFVVNFVTHSIENNHYKRIHRIIEESLQKILPTNYEILISPINLYQQIDEDNETQIIKKEFGVDILFKTIYNIYKPMIIDLDLIKDINDISGLYNFFGNNPLYSQFKKVNDIYISFRSDMINVILFYSIKKFKSKEKIIEEMIDKLYKGYTGKPCQDYNSIIRKVASDDEEKKIIDEFYKCINNLILLKKHIYDYNFLKFISDNRILAIGYICLIELEKTVKDNPNFLLEKDTANKELVFNLCNSLNTAINSFSILSKKFEKYYQETEKKDISIEISK